MRITASGLLKMANFFYFNLLEKYFVSIISKTYLDSIETVWRALLFKEIFMIKLIWILSAKFD